MNYQLMFQVIAIICGATAFLLGVSMTIDGESSKSSRALWVILFIITLISGALAAGLS